MSKLSPVKTSADAGIPIFAKILELFAGGFSYVLSGKTGVSMPAGSLITVDEATRIAVPVKSSKLLATNSTTVLLVPVPNPFEVGDVIGVDGTNTGHSISTIVASGANEAITVATAIGIGATGDVVYEVTAIGTGDAAMVVKSVANAITYERATIGDFCTAVLRGTAFRKRIQPCKDEHLADMEHIHFSESY